MNGVKDQQTDLVERNRSRGSRYPLRHSAAKDAGDIPAHAGRAPGLAVGKDSLDWSKIFAAARTGGLKNYFVEQSWDLTVQSVAYLKGLKV